MLLQPSYHRSEGTDGAAEAQGDSAAGDSVCGPRSRSLFEQQVEHQPPGCFGQSQVTPGGRLAGCECTGRVHTGICTHACDCVGVGSPGGSVVNTLPASAGDLGSISSLG